MKQILLVAVLAALASSALTLLAAGALRSAPAVPASAGGPATAADFKAALADLEREVAALRREMAAGEAPAPPPSAPGAAPSSAPRPIPSAAAPVVRESRSPEVPVAPPESLKRFAEALPRTSDDDRDQEGRRAQKRRWLFRSEREVLDWFGLPETINAEGEKETWYYEIPTGAVDEEGYPETRSFWIMLNRGRLTDLGD